MSPGRRQNLAASAHRDQFVLKGATLFDLWLDTVHRATRDVDLLGFGEPDVGRLQTIFRELCMVDVQPDGLLFFEDSVRSESIRSALEYGGVRVRLAADLDGARIALRPEFTSDVGKRAQWSAFSWRTEMSPVLSLESIAEVLRRLLLPAGLYSCSQRAIQSGVAGRRSLAVRLGLSAPRAGSPRLRPAPRLRNIPSRSIPFLGHRRPP